MKDHHIHIHLKELQRAQKRRIKIWILFLVAIIVFILRLLKIIDFELFVNFIFIVLLALLIINEYLRNKRLNHMTHLITNVTRSIYTQLPDDDEEK